LSKELEDTPIEVQKLVFKDENVSISNYSSHIFIEEMNYMMQCALKYQQLQEAWFKGIENNEPTIFYLRKSKEIIEDFEMPTRKAMT
jgi:hypothetical protein